MTELVIGKKLGVFIASVLFAIVDKVFELNTPPSIMEQILYGGSAYMIGQGIADHGKEKAKIERGIK